MAATELSKSMNEFLTKLQDDLKEAMNTMMCTKCEGKHKCVLLTLSSQSCPFVQASDLCYMLLHFYVHLSMVFSTGALRWTVSLARPDSVLNVINGTVPRRETCGLNLVCWDCASRTSPSWMAKSLTLLVTHWHPHCRTCMMFICCMQVFRSLRRMSLCSHRVGRLSAYKHLSRHTSRAISYLFRL